MDWPIAKRIAPSCRARRDLSSDIKMSKPEVVRFRTFVPGSLDRLAEFIGGSYSLKFAFGKHYVLRSCPPRAVKQSDSRF